jgi:uncharacterized caspase-like protein
MIRSDMDPLGPSTQLGTTRRDALRLIAAACGSLLLPNGRAMGQPSQPSNIAKRIALVIGNGDYKVGALKNPVADAGAVAESLKQLGFAVTLRENTPLRGLIESLREFSQRAATAAVRVVFYAGHGVQSKGRNYLLPVDTDIQTEDEIATKSADVNELLDRLSAIKHGINIVILDACRVNPFAGGVIVGPDGRRLKFRGASPSGLAQLDAPIGTLVAFSTAPGGVALDGPGGKHSIYTKHLLNHLAAPGMPIEQLFKKVRIAVAEETQRIQVPWESSSLTAEFCFRTGMQGSCGV